MMINSRRRRSWRNKKDYFPFQDPLGSKIRRDHQLENHQKMRVAMILQLTQIQNMLTLATLIIVTVSSLHTKYSHHLVINIKIIKFFSPYFSKSTKRWGK